MHKRKRIEVIIDEPSSEAVIELLDANRVSGYTVVRGISGRGSGGKWREDRLIGAQQHVVIICVLDVEAAKSLMTRLEALFRDQSGIVSVQDVEVLRPQRFH